MERLSSLALAVSTGLSIVALIGGKLAGGHIPLALFLAYQKLESRRIG